MIYDQKLIEDTLNSHKFTHKFYVKYSVLCAEYAHVKANIQMTKESALAMDLAKRFSRGEIIEQKVMRDAANAAYAAANAAAYAAAYAAYAAAYAANAAAYAAAYAAYAAAYAAANAANAANAAAYAAANAANYKDLYEILMNLIETEYSKLERKLLEKRTA